MIQIELMINSLIMNQFENMSWWIGLKLNKTIANSHLLFKFSGETVTSSGSKTGSSKKQQKKIVDAAEKVKRGYLDKGMAKMRMLFG